MSTADVTWALKMSHERCECHMSAVNVTWSLWMWHERCECHMSTVNVTWALWMPHERCECHISAVNVMSRKPYDWHRSAVNVTWELWCHMTGVFKLTHYFWDWRHVCKHRINAITTMHERWRVSEISHDRRCWHDRWYKSNYGMTVANVASTGDVHPTIARPPL